MLRKPLFERIKDERGSTLIFLLIIMSGIVALTIVYVHASNRASNIAYSDEVIFLSARSVLSEYDLDLLEEYGLFAFEADEKEISEKIAYYSSYSFKNRKSIDLGDIETSMSGKSLINCEVFREEIESYMKYVTARKLLSDEKIFNRGEGVKIDKSGKRTLVNGRTADSLPSGGSKGAGGIRQKVRNALDNADDILTEGGKDHLLNLYCLEEFKNAQNQDIARDTFYKYELEYLIEGSRSDKKNREDFRHDLLLVRNAVNLMYLASDPAKRKAIEAAEAVISGPAGIAVSALVAEMWALAESENDLRLLEDGKKVPAKKDSGSWALDLDSVLKGEIKGYVDPHNLRGLTYQDYLLLFLSSLDETTKLSRMMDLIQINMQGNYSGSFLLRDHNVGFNMKVDVNGREYAYEHSY